MNTFHHNVLWISKMSAAYKMKTSEPEGYWVFNADSGINIKELKKTYQLIITNYVSCAFWIENFMETVQFSQYFLLTQANFAFV